MEAQDFAGRTRLPPFPWYPSPLFSSPPLFSSTRVEFLSAVSSAEPSLQSGLTPSSLHRLCSRSCRWQSKCVWPVLTEPTRTTSN
eukprot:767175-Hanusia_phi.AAC.11